MAQEGDEVTGVDHNVKADIEKQKTESKEKHVHLQLTKPNKKPTRFDHLDDFEITTK